MMRAVHQHVRRGRMLALLPPAPLLWLGVCAAVNGAGQPRCSFAGSLIGGGVRCGCKGPWQGARCNALATPPELRGADEYSAAARAHGHGPFVVAQCDTRGLPNPDCTDGLNAALASAPGSTVFLPILPGKQQWSARGVAFASSGLRIV
eukprot:SAG31_NODE_21046_length_559_cov_0.773913_1_plen_148_part_10